MPRTCISYHSQLINGSFQVTLLPQFLIHDLPFYWTALLIITLNPDLLMKPPPNTYDYHVLMFEYPTGILHD